MISYISHFSQKLGSDISHKSSPWETIFHEMSKPIVYGHIKQMTDWLYIYIFISYLKIGFDISFKLSLQDQSEQTVRAKIWLYPQCAVCANSDSSDLIVSTICTNSKNMDHFLSTLWVNSVNPDQTKPMKTAKVHIRPLFALWKNWRVQIRLFTVCKQWGPRSHYIHCLHKQCRPRSEFSMLCVNNEGSGSVSRQWGLRSDYPLFVKTV